MTKVTKTVPSTSFQPVSGRSGSVTGMQELCPRCAGVLDRNTAGYSEHGLVCRPCHRELEARLAGQAGAMHVDSWDVELINAAGAAVGFATGIGFAYVEGYAGEQIHPRTHPAFFVYLRRDGRRVGPFHVRALERMWGEGGVRPTDEYFYPGMEGWKPVSEFVPPKGG